MTATLDWMTITTAAADRFDGRAIELAGFMAPPEPDAAHAYFLLLAEPMCCVGCWPADPLAAVEVFAAEPVPAEGRAVRLVGRWSLVDEPDGWRYQLRDARLVGIEPAPAEPPALSRRGLLAAGALLGLAACAPVPVAAPAAPTASAPAPPDDAAVARVIAQTAPADLHSHAGRVIISRNGVERPFLPVSAPMRVGGMALVSLAVVADTPTTHIEDGRIRPYRTPAAGELYGWSRNSFARAHRLATEQGLAIVTDRASLDAASAERPSVVIAAEGADFLEGVVDRVDEAYETHKLRHLQLTHYRVNELGDIQTEPAVHGGLSDFGAEVVRRCNARGIVVDVAHGTYDLVKRAAAVTTKPILLSHTSLVTQPRSWTRRITPEHARLVAETGGVIGIWPPTTEFPDMRSLARGMARMVDVVGVDHVGLGSDMLGLLSPAAFANYDQLPDLARALLAEGFHPDEASRILGGNYLRVFRATLA
jgi:membrane dipeptidase